MENIQTRLIKLCTVLAAIFGGGLVYVAIIKFSGFAVPCVFYTLFGIHCPGCGLTRMAMALLSFDIKAAMGYNLAMFVLLPFITVFFVRRCVIFVKRGRVPFSKGELLFLAVVGSILLVFTILRNLPAFSFLAP